MTLLFEPFAPLMELSRELDRVLAPNGASARAFMPPADVVVTAEDVTVTMDVPGSKASEIDVELVDDVLTVRGERAFPYGSASDDGRSWRRLERGFGKFERTLRLPKGLDPDAIRGEMTDGVLTLHIPMPETRRPRRIEISSGGSQPAIEGTVDGRHAGERELAGAAA